MKKLIILSMLFTAVTSTVAIADETVGNKLDNSVDATKSTANGAARSREHAVKHGTKATEHGVKSGANSTKHVAKSATEATENGVKSGADSTKDALSK